MKQFGEEAKGKNIHLESYTAQSYLNNCKKIASLIYEGKVKPIIAEVLPLYKAAEAQKKSEDGYVVGKIVLQVI